ncbi:hypothetical protein [Nocardia africana]|uniref:Capsid maturation protease n=1 Tax=Nocardia africana TaxID=134964 RepID=A0A378X0T1_9NOCA|nr:hypothetical protein [Nocardia africana]MCC3311518.1 hypothetical protein [Nocardia africana]SUA47220.1 Uncharacterised protein [Nocardia africana]
MPPLLPPASAEYYSEQRDITAKVLRAARDIWGQRPPAEFDEWFAANADRLVATITAGQAKAVSGADDYVGRVLDQLGTPVDPDVGIDASRLVGIASDGRDLEGLLYGAIVHAKHDVGQGYSPSLAWEKASKTLLQYTQTQVADAARVATGLAITARPGVGYVRLINVPCCPRCAVLAGRWYKKASFQRHPGCDCRNIPASEDVADDLTTDPRAYFDSLSNEQQDKIFGKASAEAIRDGADISQVVNAERGMKVAGVYGRELAITTEGVTKRGIAGKAIRARGRNAKTTPRLMPEAIYQIAEDRAEVLSLLRKNGYIFDGQPKRVPKPTPQPAAPKPAPAPAVEAAPVETPNIGEAAPKRKARKTSPFAGQSTADLEARMFAKAEAGIVDDEFDALAAEIDRRTLRAQVERERRAAAREAKNRTADSTYEQLLARGVDDEEAIERAYGVPVEKQRRYNATSTLNSWGYEGKSLDAQIRAWHKDEAYRAWLQAENDTNGYMLSKAGEKAGTDPRRLWSMPEAQARKHASEELRAWWDEHGRVTKAELKAQLLDPTELARIQSSRRDFLA